MEFKKWLFDEIVRSGVILIATGALNPIHRGHIQMFYHAKRYLTSQGYNVYGAYLIPRNSEYIAMKSAAKGEQPIDNSHRNNMIQKAVQGTFIKVLPLEDQSNRKEIKAQVQALHPMQNIMWVAGDDKAQCSEGEPICNIEVPGWGPTIIIGRTIAGDASSSRVRKNLQTIGDDPALSPGVKSYIQQNGLWGAKKPTFKEYLESKKKHKLRLGQDIEGEPVVVGDSPPKKGKLKRSLDDEGEPVTVEK
jgi:nicotinic acid mononucleotide adenylyltransferase